MFDTLKAKLLGAKKSLTIAFNTVAGAVLAVLPPMQDALPMLQQYVPEIIKWTAGLVIVGNVLLRFKTSTGLQNK